MIDYMVMEAVCLRVWREDEKARKAAELEAKRQKFKDEGDEAMKNGLVFETL